MHDFTRRSLLQGGTALAAAGALTGPALLEFAKAWAQASPWKAEAGAKLTVMRWKRFVPAEDDAFNAMVAAFKTATGTADERVLGILRGRAAEGLRCRQYRFGHRSRLGPAHAAAAVPDQSAQDERRRRLSRQEVRRMDRRCRQDLQAGQRLARHPRRHRRRLHDLPQVGDRQGRFQGIPQGFCRLP